MSNPRFVLRVLKSINRFSATQDHQILYTPSNPDSTIHVVQHMPIGLEEYLYEHLDRVEVIHQVPGVNPQSFREYLFRALQGQRSSRLA